MGTFTDVGPRPAVAFPPWCPTQGMSVPSYRSSRPFGDDPSDELPTPDPLAVLVERSTTPRQQWTDLLPQAGRVLGWRLVAGIGVVVVAVALVGMVLFRDGTPSDPFLPSAGFEQAGGEGVDASTAAAMSSGEAAGVPDGPTASTEGGEGPESRRTVLVVHVVGAVRAPGVHEVPEGSRLLAVVAAAGGALDDADLDSVNLAAPVADGSRIHIPRQGEVPQVAAPVPGGVGGGGPPSASAPISISTADAVALDALPGIGPSTASAIIAYREQNGPFGTVDELAEVRGIGPSRLEALRDLVVP